MDNPFDPAASIQIAERQIALHTNRALIRGSGYTVALGVLSSLQLGILVGFGRHGFELPLAFAVAGALYSLWFRVLAKRGAVNGWVRYATMAAWASFPTAFLLTAHVVAPAGAATYINSPMLLAYFPLIFTSAFTFDWRVALFSGLVAGCGYGVVALVALPGLAAQIRASDPILQQDLTDPAVYAIRAFMVLFAGMVAAGVTVMARRLVLAGVHRAHERGSYQLLELLGHGGMGEVWLAEHRMLARPAAVKIIKPQALGRDGDERGRTVLQRFEQEAQATALLRSPHTIELFDFGLADDGTFYYVMELLDGFDLETLVDEHGPQPAERVVYLIRQACLSLAEAHARGLIHRDVKPANTHVCRYGLEVDFVKVLDFGLVKDSGGHDVRLTGEQMTLGTPAYMAPEMALGGELDGRSDIYSVGCVAYWMLTGQRVFAGETAVQVVARHLGDAPVPPSQATELEVPEALDRLVLDCLAKQPADRPADAGQLVERLDTLGLADAWSRDRRERWWQLHAPPARNYEPRAPSKRDESDLESLLDSRRSVKRPT